MMNYMEHIAKSLGVELDEEFYLAKNGVKKPYLYKLTMDGMFVNRGSSGVWEVAPIALVWTLRGICSVIKKKSKTWTPKIGETYYFIDYAGFINQVLWGDDPYDAIHYKTGNYFQTKAEAANNLDAYLRWLGSEPIADWRNKESRILGGD